MLREQVHFLWLPREVGSPPTRQWFTRAIQTQRRIVGPARYVGYGSDMLWITKAWKPWPRPQSLRDRVRFALLSASFAVVVLPMSALLAALGLGAILGVLYGLCYLIGGG